ncbi:MAG TPA: DUF1801 domain-containing protein, partial [Bacteroidia bacterium]|nr:DUF1801 domain-containing protein [Bacteroidia bacterium]
MAKLADLKTKANTLSVDDFLAGLKDEQKRKDSLIILKLMQKVSKEKPVMWGSSLIGFGKKIYESPASGRKVEWFKLGFSPRKTNFSIYVFLNDKLHS